MKIRNGFVSNSSSSSFCIYGAALEFSEILEKVKNSTVFSEDELKRFDDEEEDIEWYEIGEMDCDKYEDMQITLREINSSYPTQETNSIQFTIEEDLPF